MIANTSPSYSTKKPQDDLPDDPSYYGKSETRTSASSLPQVKMADSVAPAPVAAVKAPEPNLLDLDFGAPAAAPALQFAGWGAPAAVPAPAQGKGDE